MEDRKTEQRKRGKYSFSLRLFPVIVLAVVLVFAWSELRQPNPLFQKGENSTLYVKTEVGKEAVF